MMCSLFVSTLEERAKRLYSTKGLSPDKIDPSLFAKAKRSTGSDFTERQKEVAFLEAQIYRYVEILAVSSFGTHPHYH